MVTTQATLTLLEWGQQENWCVFSRGEIARILGEPRRSRAIETTLSSMVKAKALERVSRDIYVVPLLTQCAEVPLLDQIAQTAADPYLAVESLESAASQWGIVSQIYARGASYVTTGRTRTITCAYGSIVLVHTSMDAPTLWASSLDRGERRTRITNRETTLRLLRRTGRAERYVIEYDETAVGRIG